MLGSKETDKINNADVSVTFMDLYLSKKECEEKLLPGIHSANGLKAWVDAKKAAAAVAVIMQENVIKNTLAKDSYYL